jgi:hypothetical protein
VSSASDILHLLETGNARRKTERTDANTQSSRSHAVLEVRMHTQCTWENAPLLRFTASVKLKIFLLALPVQVELILNQVLAS